MISSEAPASPKAALHMTKWHYSAVYDNDDVLPVILFSFHARVLNETSPGSGHPIRRPSRLGEGSGVLGFRFHYSCATAGESHPFPLSHSRNNIFSYTLILPAGTFFQRVHFRHRSQKHKK